MKEPAMTKEELKERVDGFLDFIQTNQWNIHNQVKETFLDGGTGETFWIDYEFLAEPRHHNVYEIVHGGVVAILLDDCIGITASIARGSNYVTTAGMSLQYLHSLKGTRFRAHTELTHVGKRMVNGIGKVYDEEGNLCVTAMASYAVHEALKEPPNTTGMK